MSQAEEAVTKTERIVVTWDSDPFYDPEADSGSWVFTARLPIGYVLGDSVPLPEIYVMTGGVSMLADGVYNIEDASVEITSAGTYTITGKSTENTILISAASGEVEITLDNTKIESSIVSPFKIEYSSRANVTLTLQGNSLLYSTGNIDAGLQKNGNLGLLTILGNGSLIATGVHGAGIGGSNGGSTENIIITGNAKVTARSTGTSAGIGGGYGGNGKKITIDGNAIVNAYGGPGLSNGAGIGGGNLGGDGIDILIKGNAIVNAVGGNRASGIGGGYGGNGNNIAINGNALVTATGGIWSAGIGGGNADINTGGGWGTGNNVGGNAVVFATGGTSGDPVQGMTHTGGILFQGTDGKMAGDVTLTSNVNIPAGHTITIPFGNTLTNEGVLSVQGSLEYGGTNGKLVNNGTLNIRPASTTLTVNKNGLPVTQAAYSDIVILEMVAQASATKARLANTGMADFYIDTANGLNLLGNSATYFADGVATASLITTLSGDHWSAGFTPKKLRIEYGGTASNGIPGNTGMLGRV